LKTKQATQALAQSKQAIDLRREELRALRDSIQAVYEPFLERIADEIDRLDQRSFELFDELWTISGMEAA
jgi:hypothetical protein